MFRKLAVWTVVLVAVLSNDALALHQGNAFTPMTGGDQMGGSHGFSTMTPPDTPSTGATSSAPITLSTSSPTTSAGTEPLRVTPSAKTRTVEKGAHVLDCNSNFPSEKPEEAPKATHAVKPATSTLEIVKPTVSTPNLTNNSVVTPVQAVTPATDVVDSKTVSGNNEQTMQQANTQSGNQSGEASTGTGTFAFVGCVAAVATIGVAVSRVKKARDADADADAALVTPGENENIHIEIRNTPAGGSTIL
ncbi:unnamed protein product [Peronospora destructor]|uniref:Uncharacterized protein n=1 Tax=Peronospora destructor TaxID=86335 RepID=A0AAV0V079_9STRA|nr:unnamed protein product [Peronospora destructor]